MSHIVNFERIGDIAVIDAVSLSQQAQGIARLCTVHFYAVNNFDVKREAIWSGDSLLSDFSWSGGNFSFDSCLQTEDQHSFKMYRDRSHAAGSLLNASKQSRCGLIGTKPLSAMAPTVWCQWV